MTALQDAWDWALLPAALWRREYQQADRLAEQAMRRRGVLALGAAIRELREQFPQGREVLFLEPQEPGDDFRIERVMLAGGQVIEPEHEGLENALGFLAAAFEDGIRLPMPEGLNVLSLRAP